MFESIRMSHICTLAAWKVWQSTVQPPFSFIGLFLSPMLTAKEARSLSLVRTLSSQYVYVVRCRIRGFLLCVRSPVWSLKCHTTKRTAIIQRRQQRIPPTIKCRPSSAYFRQRKEALSLYDIRSCLLLPVDWKRSWFDRKCQFCFQKALEVSLMPL